MNVRTAEDIEREIGGNVVRYLRDRCGMNTPLATKDIAIIGAIASEIHVIESTIDLVETPQHKQQTIEQLKADLRGAREDLASEATKAQRRSEQLLSTRTALQNVRDQAVLDTQRIEELTAQVNQRDLDLENLREEHRAELQAMRIRAEHSEREHAKTMKAHAEALERIKKLEQAGGSWLTNELRIRNKELEADIAEKDQRVEEHLSAVRKAQSDLIVALDKIGKLERKGPELQRVLEITESEAASLRSDNKRLRALLSDYQTRVDDLTDSLADCCSDMRQDIAENRP